MQFKNILKNRLYAFPSSSNLFDDDSVDLLQNIFQDSKLNIPQKNQIEFIDSNYNYDIYKVYFNDQSVCVKITFDSEDSFLKKELNFYKKNSNIIHPRAISYNSLNYGDLLHYSIISYEDLLPIKKIANSTLLENSNLFFEYLNIINSFENPKNNINSLMNSFLKYANLNKNIPQHTFQRLKSKYDLNAIKNLIATLKLELKNLQNCLNINENKFCHGNLKLSNILFNNNDREIKFINFENYFSGHRYFDIASISIDLNLTPNLNRDFFKSFLSYHKIPFSSKELEHYNVCYNIYLRKTLIELLINYFFENFVLTQHRGSKIYEIISKYTNNVENFYKIPSFKLNYSLISDIFSESIIGNENE